MEVRLLGPPEVLVAGRPVDLGGPRQRVVLSLLALNANRVTSVDYLLDAVWGDSPPSTARGQIQICISALRKLFPETGIRTQAPGYVLELGPGQLDLDIFHERVNAGFELAAAQRLEEAAAELRTALALWRGPALAGVGSLPAEREATRLEERRTAALEERIRIDLALGRHHELIGELRALVAEQPLRERAHAFLMLGLYRCGRQADALEAGRRARAVLAEEIGVDPGPELQEMERAILARDPGLDLVPREQPAPAVTAAAVEAVPRQLPPSIADFTGRAAQLDEVRAALAGERDPYAVPVVAISGPGGAGKSSLALRSAHALAADYPDGQLYADLSGAAADGGSTRQLARFLRALGVPGNAVPDDPEERAELYRSRLAGRRALVLLDDVAGEEQVLPLLPGSPSCAVMTTSRSRLTGLPGAHQVVVDALDHAQSVDLLGQIIGTERIAAEPEAAAELVGLCDGLPLALRIAGARLASRPHWRVEELVNRLADESRRLDEFVHKGLELRSNISLTYRGLSPRHRRLFRLCTLVRAPDFPGWAAAALLDCGRSEAEELVEDLVDAQVLEVRTAQGERGRHYRLHDLVRVFGLERLAAEEPAAEQRAAVERYLGGWLALCDAAHRRVYGGDYTVLHGPAMRWRPPDAELPEPVADPLTWWERERHGLVPAIRQAAADGFPQACWDLALTSVTLFEIRSYFDDWVETASLAAQATAAAGDRRGQAAAAYALGSLALTHKQLPEAAAHFDAALTGFAATGDTHGRALVLRNQAFISRVRGDLPGAVAQYEEALARLRAAGDRAGEAHVLASLAKLRLDEGDTAAARAMLDEAAGICRAAGCPRVEAQVTYRLGELHLGDDNLELARQVLHRTLRVTRDLDDRVGEAYALQALGTVRHREGRLDVAHATLSHALSLATEVGDRWIEGQTLYGLGEVTMARGNDRAAIDYLERADACFAALDSALWRAKSLLLIAEISQDAADHPRSEHCLETAAGLLSGLDSVEAGRLARQAVRLRVAA
jgi:DNA-binding SARP family transcriptional activator